MALEQEYALLAKQEQTTALVHLGRDVADPASAASTLQQHLHQAGGGPRHVLLDGLDEGLSDIPGLDNVLVKQLRALSQAQREGLRLRITCRTTRWPERLESGLRELWPEAGQVALMSLESLTRQDMRSAAAQHGLDEGAFVDEVCARGLEALAEQPVTLIPLLKSREEGEELPRTVAQAYDQACRRLCAETRDQSFAQRQESPTVDHLLGVARWAAAALQFSRSPVLTAQEPVRDNELHLDSLVGPDVPGLVPRLECRSRELWHLAESGLLTPLGQRRWAFVHRSYQEHLAAQYLLECVTPAVRSELLWAGSGPARHIVPENAEVAARLAVDDPQLLEELLTHDPLTLLLADLTSLPAELRQRIVQALLDTAPDEGFHRLDFTLLDQLAHPELAAQLAPFLCKEADPDQRYLALWIAAKCQPTQLAPVILSFAEDTRLDAQHRSFALRALAEEESAHDEVVARLHVLAEDSSPGVAEGALERLWPRHLTLTEYFNLLPVRRLFGYQPQLERALDLITAEQVEEALAWCATTLESQSPKSLIAIRLLAQCIPLMDRAALNDPETSLEQAGQTLVALAASADILRTSDPRTPLKDLRESLAAAPALRRRLAEFVLRHGNQEQALELTWITPQAGLFPEEDLLYWAERWLDLPQGVRRAAQPLFDHRPRPDSVRLRAALEQARQTDENLKNATAWWDAPPTDWQLRQQAREEEQRRRRTFDADQFATAMQTVHSAAPDHVCDAWRAVLGHLYRTDDGRGAESAGYLNAVAAAPSCPPEGSALHQQLIQAAVHVLAAAPVWSARDLADGTTAWRDVAELTAAGFVTTAAWQAAVPATAVRKWAGWALALATMPLFPQEADLHHRLLTQCVHHAGPAFTTALTDGLDGLGFHRLTEMVRVLHPLAAAEPIVVLRDWAAAPGRSDSAWAAVSITLARLGDQRARAQVEDTVAAGPPRAGTEPSQERWLAAALALMDEAALPESWPHIRRALDEPSLHKALIDRLTDGGSHHWPAGVAELDATDLADLYARLREREELQRPRPEHEPGIAYVVTPEDLLHDFADALLRLITDKGTQHAASQLNQLADSDSNPSLLRRLARRTLRQAAQQQSPPLPVSRLRKLATDHSLRVITDEAQLLDVVMEALDSVQAALSGSNGLALLLWNREAARDYHAMWPTWEEDFSDLVMGLLKIHLSERRIILNREVQIDRPGVGGGRTDIHIQAAASSHDTDPFTVVIEAKGCWNPGLPTALATQLVARYLRRPRTAGIFLVGFFDCDQWHAEQRPHCSPRHTLQQIEHDQQEQAARQDALVRTRILDCRPPGAQID
ncbi:hypothetical protein ACIBL6_20380 [Streptomyces sp. NPDC050400]|uniref:hypothetical protein n=1 Tax=Streptomyces sp. NPDC050400 TaxID=3365610 RepID=UPI0037B52720